MLGYAFIVATDEYIDAVVQNGSTPILVAQNTLAVAGLQLQATNKIRYKWVLMNHRNLVIVNDLMARAMREVAAEHKVPCIDVRDEINGNLNHFFSTTYI